MGKLQRKMYLKQNRMGFKSIAKEAVIHEHRYLRRQLILVKSQ